MAMKAAQVRKDHLDPILLPRRRLIVCAAERGKYAGQGFQFPDFAAPSTLLQGDAQSVLLAFQALLGATSNLSAWDWNSDSQPCPKGGEPWRFVECTPEQQLAGLALDGRYGKGNALPSLCQGESGRLLGTRHDQTLPLLRCLHEQISTRMAQLLQG